ncbi:MAG: globin domain-containing protein [Bacteroidota bacterium]
MTDSQIQLIQKNWAILKPDTTAIADTFYQLLFQNYPAIKALFPVEHHLQVNKLGEMLEYIVHHLDRLDILMPQIQLMGIRHQRYLVQSAHYPPVGMALIGALQEHSQEHWTTALEEAWIAAYQLLAEIMITSYHEE